VNGWIPRDHLDVSIFVSEYVRWTLALIGVVSREHVHSYHGAQVYVAIVTEASLGKAPSLAKQIQPQFPVYFTQFVLVKDQLVNEPASRRLTCDHYVLDRALSS